MSSTKIEWADEVWNPVTGCTPISEGCANCYAQRMAKRLAGRFGYSKDEPFKVTLHPDRLDKPLHWRRSRRVFVCSMGDLFHEDVPFEFIDDIYRVMVNSDHTYLVLTKRPVRALEYYRWAWPADYPENIWLGVTAENQDQANRRIPILLQTPAAVRFVSIEPMLGPIDLYVSVFQAPETPFDGGWGWPKFCNIKTTNLTYPDSAGLDWVICGGETGPGARPMHPDWVRSIRDQCVAANVPFFFKRWGIQVPYIECEDGTVMYMRDNAKYPARQIDGCLWEEYPDGQNNHQ